MNFSDERAGYLGAYIHNNPVRAGIVQNAADSTWSSHRAYIGMEPAPEFLHVAKGLALSGNEDSVRGRQRFHEYVSAHAGNPSDSRLSDKRIAAIRNAERERRGPTVELRSPHVTGNGVLYETLTVSQAHPKAAFDGSTMQFLNLVAEITGVTVEQMQSSSRDRRTASARRTAVLAWRALDRRTGEIAASLAIGAPAATQLARRRATFDRNAQRSADIVVDRCRAEIRDAGNRKK